jgi:type II protein arginine methyltransferase
MHNNFGVVLNALGEIDAAEAAFARALALKPDYAEALNNLGSIHRLAGRIEQAVDSFRQALDLKPDYAEAKSNLRAAYRDVIPAWHFAMMNDEMRNQAYDTAIRRAAPAKRVLDIGTGAGLLAMMAARAGASEVTTVEMVALIAERARSIVAENGLADRVRVHAKPSTALVIGQDLAERAEILVTETFSSGLLNEGVLPTLEHAHEHLLAPGATIIPAAASAMGYLVGGDMLRDKLFVDRAAGFELRPFNDFAPPKIGLYLDREPHEILSDDVELIRFDLRQRRFPMSTRRMAIKATRAGTCVGVAQWLMLELDEETRYANRPAPDAGSNGWTHIVYRFSRALRLKEGDIVRLIVRHDREQISIDLPE